MEVAEGAPPRRLPRELVDALPPATDDEDTSFDAMLDGASEMLAQFRRGIGAEAKELVPAYNAEKDSDFLRLRDDAKKRVQVLNAKAALARQALLREVQMCVSVAGEADLFDGARQVGAAAERGALAPGPEWALDIQPLRDLLLHSTFQYLALLAEIRSIFDTGKRGVDRAAPTLNLRGDRTSLYSSNARAEQRKRAEYEALVDQLPKTSKAPGPKTKPSSKRTSPLRESDARSRSRGRQRTRSQSASRTQPRRSPTAASRPSDKNTGDKSGDQRKHFRRGGPGGPKE